MTSCCPSFLVSMERLNKEFNVQAAKTGHFVPITHLNSHLLLPVGVDGLWWTLSSTQNVISNIYFASFVLCELCFWNLRICVHICAFM